MSTQNQQRRDWRRRPEILHGKLIRVGSLNPEKYVNSKFKIMILGFRQIDDDKPVEVAHIDDYVLIVNHRFHKPGNYKSKLFVGRDFDYQSKLCAQVLNARGDLLWCYADEL